MSYPNKFGEGTESPAELALALAMDGAGLTYEKQKEFNTSESDLVMGGAFRPLNRTYRVDFWFPDADLAVEVDGYSYHSSEEIFEKDREKDRLIFLLWGVTVIRLSAREVFTDPRWAASLIRSIWQEVLSEKDSVRACGLGCNGHYGDPLRPGEMGGLQCPSCFGECMHIVRTIEGKGGSDGIRPTVDITYECEQCGRKSTMTHTNHKGDAIIAWSNVGIA